MVTSEVRNSTLNLIAMKKILLPILALLFTLSGFTQQTNCNSFFAFTINGNTVSFIPAVLGDSATTRHLWSFGDGTSSDRRDPSHTYIQCGTYTVKHLFKVLTTSGNVACMDSTTLQLVILCLPNCELTANFTTAVQTTTANSVQVNFTNTSLNLQPTDSCFWNFGDGSPISNQVSPTHVYPANGNYNVCLRVKRNAPNPTVAPCVREICKPVIIANISTCNIRPSFVKVPSPAVPLRVLFTNTTPVLTANVATALWIFGDGTTANTWHAEHSFPAPGRYRVCLKITYGNNCVSDICDSITVEPPRVIRCDSVFVRVDFRREPTLPNRVYFFTHNNVPVVQETWTITPIGGQTGIAAITLNQINPVYQFTSPGLYRVCLRAVTVGSCVKESCDSILVGPSPNACELTAYPNPAQSQVSVNVNLNQPRMINAVLYNGQFNQVGSVSQWGTTGINPITFNIGALPAGNYIIKVTAGDRICFARFSKY